jgi:uncharacterized protein YlxW (UPF0749 family)
MALILALVGFLVATGFVQERLRHAPDRVAELRGLVERRQATIAELSEEVDRLSTRVARVRSRAAEESGRVREAVSLVEELEAAAGLEPLAGPGMVVELSDSPRRPRTREEVVSFRIQDVDLQLVVNALWRAGAEAVAVNDRRVVSMTAIRKAGTTILVNYRAVASPYRVVAIGDPEGLRARFEGSEIVERFAVWKDVYGLGFSVEARDRITVPALEAPPDLRHARPVRAAP